MPVNRAPSRRLRPDSSPPAVVRTGLRDLLEMKLAAARDAPAAARTAVTAWMAGRVSQAMLTDVQLVVAELVANSVRHANAVAGAAVRVRAQVRPDAVWLEVEDGGSTGAIVRRAPDLENGGGFGLNIVDTLSARWGVTRDPGTRVWVELAFRRPDKTRDRREPGA